MGLEMESDSDKNSTGLSPDTVLPSPRHYSNIEKRNAKLKATRRDDLLRVKKGFTEISFLRYRSASAKSIPSRPVGPESNIEPQRGSIYQCSKEVRKMKTMGAIEGRKKIELSRCSDSSFSFRITDSLCSLEEGSSRKRASVMSVSSNSNASSVCRPSIEPCPSAGFIEFCPSSDGTEKPSSETAQKGIVEREKLSTETASRDIVGDLNFRCDEVVGTLNDGNELLKRDTVLTLQKSHSAKVELCYSPSLSGIGHSSRGSSKTRFSPIRKMFDPFMKSKSLRSPLGYVLQPDEVKTTGMENMGKEGTFRKSWLHNFSPTYDKSEFNSPFLKKDQHHSVVANSPVHLHGLLKLENKQGIPFFEFSLNCPEEVIVARPWKEDNAFNWVYTFHSVDHRKKNNASGWDSNKDCSMVGQMQVSCYLCSELNDDVVFDNCVMTEFVLFDIAHARQSVISQDYLKCSSDGTPPKHSKPGFVEGNHELYNESDLVKFKDRPRYASSNESNSCPWPSGDLGRNLEIAAVVIQVPFEKRESLTYKRGDKVSDKMHSNLLNFSTAGQREKYHLESKISEKVKVVIPTGNHGLPSAESQGPSSLLDRWRFGGGCDCGGWDMACPLTVFSNPNIQCAEDRPILENQQPVELFVQGAKENTPALTMIVQEEGQYAIHFHAQLSTLQAFSICVAILHGTEVSIPAGQDRSIQFPHCKSLKVLIEEEVKFLIDAVMKEEKKKVTKRVEEIPPSYVINPPFSPIARI